MKFLKVVAEIARYLVSLVFIFSGLVKINDPMGLAIKLKEYFYVFADDFGGFFELFVPIALPLAVFLVVLEFALGVALILGYQMRLVAWALAVLIVFFTFLTFYSAIFDKVTDCGCFGDAIPLTPMQSFIKDLILCALILPIFLVRNELQAIVKKPLPFVGTLASAILGFVLCGVALAHLPFLDFRAYKVGADIPAKMQGGEQTEPLRYGYYFWVGGEMTFYEEYPGEPPVHDSMTYELLNPEALPEPPEITDFFIWDQEGEVTSEVLSGTKVLVVFHKIEEAKEGNMSDIYDLSQSLPRDMPLVVLSSSEAEKVVDFLGGYSMQAPVYFGDETVLKALVRANPGIVLLREGVVLGKWHNNDTPTAEKLRKLAQGS